MPMCRYDPQAQKRPRGAAVRAARLAQEIPLRDMAYFAKTTEASLSRIERGLQEPSVSLKVRIARVLGESVADLFPLAEVSLADLTDDTLARLSAISTDDER